MNAPLDQLHADCIAARAWVRAEVERLRAAAAAWSPRPMDCGTDAGWSDRRSVKR